MATVEVSTWAQLRSAVANATNGDVIKLIADINCNNEIPEGVPSTTDVTAVSLTIDGSYQEGHVTKNHVIKNLRTHVSSPVDIFRMYNSNGSNVTVKHIDFLNLILDRFLVNFFLGSAHSWQTYVYNYWNFNDCRFTGRRTFSMFGTRTGSNVCTRVTFNRCYFNIPYYGTSQGFKALVRYLRVDTSQGTGFVQGWANNCRILETYTGTFTPTYSTSQIGDYANLTPSADITDMNLSGCRVEGKIVFGNNSSTPTYNNAQLIANIMYNTRTPSIQNVYDVDFYFTTNYTKDIDLKACKGVFKRPIQLLDDEQITFDTFNSVSTGIILATKSEMQDADWLIQQGFDIVPSNQGG